MGPMGDPGQGIRPPPTRSRRPTSTPSSRVVPAEFTFRLLIATTDDVASARTLDDQPRAGRDSSAHNSTCWGRVADFNRRLRPREAKRKKPRPHVSARRSRLRAGTRRGGSRPGGDGLRNGKDTRWPVPRGGLEAKRMLVLVPSLSLSADAARVGDGDRVRLSRGVLRRHGSPDEHDAVVASTSELGVPVTTDAAGSPASYEGAGGTGHLLDLPVLAADRRRASRGRPGVRPCDCRRGAPLRGPRGVFATDPDPTKIKAAAPVYDRDAALLHRRVKPRGERGRLGGRLDGRGGEVRPGPAPAHVRGGDRAGSPLRLPGRGGRA